MVQGECDGECCGCSAVGLPLPSTGITCPFAVAAEADPCAAFAMQGLSPTGMLCLEALGPEIYAAAKQYSTRDLCSSCIYTKDGLEMPPSNSDM